MRILAFSDVALPEGSGGVERQIFEVYGRIVRRHRADVRLIALGRKGLPREEIREGVLVKRSRQLPLDRVTGAQATVSPFVWRSAWEEVRRFKPDVIHANTLFYATTLAAAAVAARAATPLVVTAHIGHLDALSQPYRAASKAYEATVGRWVLGRASRVICIGEAVQDHIVSIGVRRERTSSVPNGVDSGVFFPGTGNSDGVLTIVSVGRLIFNKGNQYLLEALRGLSGRGRAFRLVIVGDGPMRTALARQTAELGLEDVVSFAGRRDDVPEVLRAADIYVRPSLTESMPMGVLEAMSSGLAVVASDAGATGEIIDNGRNGLLVAPRSVADLRTALERLLADPALRARLGAAARVTAVEYDWERVADATFGEFARAVAACRAS
jgi:glycosyltransferase involved in cell wall biosynthesis